MFIKNKENPLEIKMVEGDFGIPLLLELTIQAGEEITEGTSFQINIFKEEDTPPIVSKTYTNIQNNIIEFVLTEEESSLLPKDNYIYDLDWYQDGVFMDNIIAAEKYLVVKKGKKVGGVNES